MCFEFLTLHINVVFLTPKPNLKTFPFHIVEELLYLEIRIFKYMMDYTLIFVWILLHLFLVIFYRTGNRHIYLNIEVIHF